MILEKCQISRVSGLSADQTHTLPSVRELLSTHLHDEIEFTPCFMLPQKTRGRPRPAHNHRLPHSPAAKIPLEAPTLAPDNTPHTSNVNTRYTFGECSTILPSIQDLPSLAGLNTRVYTGALPGTRDVARPDSFPPADYRNPVVSSHGYQTSPIGERRAADRYVVSGKSSLMHDEAPHQYTGMTSLNGADMVSHTQRPGNLGINEDSANMKNKRRRGNLPGWVTDILRAWLQEHLDDPYPGEEDKQMFMKRTGLTLSQVRWLQAKRKNHTDKAYINNWFINARRRQLPVLLNQVCKGDAELDTQRRLL